MTQDGALIQVERISYSYPGFGTSSDRVALMDASLTVVPGEFVALIGQNGSGKTTLAKHLNGLLKPSTGRVLVGEWDTQDVVVGELARHVGYVFQNPDHQLFLPSVRREVAYGPAQLGMSGNALHLHVDAVLDRFDLSSFADHHPAALGRGLRRLTALAAVYAMGPRVLVLDEPTGGLDQRLTERLMAMLQRLVAEEHAVVLVTHEMPLVARYATRAIVLRDGHIVADEPPDTLFDKQELLIAAHLRAPDPALVAADLRADGMPTGITTVDGFVTAFVRLVRERK